MQCNGLGGLVRVVRAFALHAARPARWPSARNALPPRRQPADRHVAHAHKPYEAFNIHIRKRKYFKPITTLVRKN